MKILNKYNNKINKSIY